MAEQSETKRRLVIPRTLRGFQDLMPEEMIARNDVAQRIIKIYEKYGFLPLDTPILEYDATLVGAGGQDKEIFRLESPEGEPIGMRFDLTMSFARIIAQYLDKISLPFRRYQIGPAFRADRPSPGRYRQFTQLDIDAAGSASIYVDAEIVAVMCEVLREIGLTNYVSTDGSLIKEFQVTINNRTLVDALLEGNGITDREKYKHVLRVVDKLQKVGVNNVQLELGEGRVDESGDPIDGVGLSTDVIHKILDFISIKGDSRKEVVELLEEQLPDTESSKIALQDMQEMASALESLGVEEYDAVFDPSLTRGLDYYTGPVFEAFLTNAPHFGSIMGGGRYDHLVERFSGTRVPCTGASIGLDRLFVALKELDKVEIKSTTTKVLILSMAGVPVAELLKVASGLRRSGLSTEVYIGKPGESMRNQLSYANSRGIPIAVIIGEDELKAGKVSVKDLKLGREKREGIQERKEYVKAGRVGQITVERGELEETVKDVLESQ